MSKRTRNISMHGQIVLYCFVPTHCDQTSLCCLALLWSCSPISRFKQVVRLGLPQGILHWDWKTNGDESNEDSRYRQRWCSHLKSIGLCVRRRQCVVRYRERPSQSTNSSYSGEEAGLLPCTSSIYPAGGAPSKAELQCSRSSIESNLNQIIVVGARDWKTAFLCPGKHQGSDPRRRKEDFFDLRRALSTKHDWIVIRKQCCLSFIACVVVVVVVVSRCLIRLLTAFKVGQPRRAADHCAGNCKWW